jgi:tetratricopeptide (TPR) repeat protein
MRHLTPLASLLLAGLAAHASPAAAAPRARPPAPAADVLKQARALLSKGRKLEDKKQYAEAIAAFEALTKLVPDDAVALSELGFTAYLAKDLGKAETATRAALARQATPSVKGATLYNLGLIQEARGDKAGAIVSYLESLRVRPHAVVLARLAKLDATAAAALDPYRPAPLASVASVDAFCKALPAKDEAGFACGCHHPEPLRATKLAAPFDAVEVFTRTCEENSPGREPFGDTTDYVAVKVGGAWYVDKLGVRTYNHHCTTNATYDDATVTAGHLLLAYAEDGDCVGGDREGTWKVSRVAVLGVGPSQAASAMPVLAVRQHETEQTEMFDDPPGAVKTTADVELTLDWSTPGSLTVAGTKTVGLEKAAAKRLLGTHALAFP